MVFIIASLIMGLVPVCLAESGLVFNPKNMVHGSTIPSIPIDISSMVNNRAFAMSEGDANFDNMHSGYPAQYIPGPNLTYAGVNYIFPQYNRTSGGYDNVLALGQTLKVPRGRYFSIHLLVASETTIATASMKATYADSSTTASGMVVHAFRNQWTPFGGDIIFPYTLNNDSVDYNRSMIFHQVNWLDSSRELDSIQLPNVTNQTGYFNDGQLGEIRLHIFSLSLIPLPQKSLSGNPVSLEVEYARSTQLWIEGTNKTQIVEVTINNIGADWVLSHDHVEVTVESPGMVTEVLGVINRLRPGDQVIVQVGVVNKPGIAIGTSAEATVHITSSNFYANATFNATHGIRLYEPTYESIYKHESPQWYNCAKFGIFIHWGIYSVPGWGNFAPNEVYAEWYWWDIEQGPSDPTWTHQLDTYGPKMYDAFFPNFTASAWDPKEWVDLFADAGAQYFVQVAKHHDGYAIFDNPANVTERTSVAQPPHRDLLRELFEAAKQYQPNLHRTTYFSLPEWYNPAYGKYGFFKWAGINASDVYTPGHPKVPYTGYVAVDDFVRDIQLPQMKALAEMGSEILWCDIGGPNATAEFAAEYFNNAAQNGRQVLINNRCALPGDIDTPEYAQYNAIQPRKWESNLGMDPFSYGYNRATPVSSYMKVETLLHTLVDITSKNGNLLLDVGPQANGTIIDVEQRNLRAAGKWLKDHAEESITRPTGLSLPKKAKYASPRLRMLSMS